MDLGIAGKVALVAASSRGLGRAAAAELAAEGVSLVMCARGAEGLRAAAEALRGKHDVRVLDIAADLTDPADADRVAASARDAFGHIDILVTNTGGPPPGRFLSHSPESWDHAVRQNLFSVTNLARAVLPDMRERRWGRIVNITSIAVKQPVDELILSNSVRAAVTGFARTLANEVAAEGITVNNVMPGYTRTERLEELANRVAERKGLSHERRFDAWNDEIPMRRLGEPHELAALIAFLASERASFITGQSIAVDGGWIRSLL
jgi:3-oxoacyl-[acyl-carrier protein] reductase